MKKVKIGVLGMGFVGNAVAYAFSTPNTEIVPFDIKLGTTAKNVLEQQLDYVFVCLPTPMSSDGSVDASIVLEALNILRDMPCLIILKSTVPPSVVKKLPINCIYNPEFLKEKTAVEDFVYADYHIIGTNSKTLYNRFVTLYKKYSKCISEKYIRVSPEEASLIKYATNAFLATKVTFFNQLYELAADEQADFYKIVRIMAKDDRIGESHTLVPGFDGKKGFGGSCFPKDTLALARYSKHMSLLDAVTTINNKIRSTYELDNREKEQNVSFN